MLKLPEIMARGERKKVNLAQMFCPLAAVNMHLWFQETMLISDGWGVFSSNSNMSKVSVDLCLVFE